MYTSTCSFTGKRTVVVSGHMRSGVAFHRLFFTVLCDLVVSICFRALNTLVLFRFLDLRFLDLSLRLVFLGFALLPFLNFLSPFACSWRRGNRWRNSG